MRSKILYYLFVGFLVVVALKLSMKSSSKSSHLYDADSLENLMKSIPDSRLQISKLKGSSKLGVISMWLAFPSSEAILPGAQWYKQVWDEQRMGGSEDFDDMISLSPCHDYDKTFIQIGAHLGIFPLLATYRQCRGIAVEPMPLALNFSKISARLNHWNDDQFLGINAISSDKPGGHMWFDPATISISYNNSNLNGNIRVPVTTLDELNDLHGASSKNNKPPIRFVVIDVEGHEQEVLMGGRRLIEERSVFAFEIEVWTSKIGRGIIDSFPGLELLKNNGYRLYMLSNNPEMNFKPCDEVTNRLLELPIIMNYSCSRSPVQQGNCLNEIFAIRSDQQPPQNWLRSCPK